MLHRVRKGMVCHDREPFVVLSSLTKPMLAVLKKAGKVVGNRSTVKPVIFEPRLGYDLSGARIHAGDTAAESAHAINAKAYTLGRDIVFGRFASRFSHSNTSHCGSSPHYTP